MQSRFRVASIAGILAMAAALMVAMAVTATADEPSRAGLVIVSGPADVHASCVSFSSAEVTGLELLQRAGLVVIQAGAAGVGDSVCKIGAVGCSFPAEHCFCQCLSTPCYFWSYWYWQDGDWVFSQRGAGSRRVRDGAVEAWVWGDGQTRPPSLDVAAICSPSPRLSAPASQAGYPGPGEAPQPQPTVDPYPGPDDDHPEPTPEEPTAEAPVDTPAPEQHVATPEPAATATETPTPSVTPTRATPTATITATLATPSPTPGPSATPTDDGMAAAIATAVARNRAAPTEPRGGSSAGSYVAFGLLALALAGLIVYAVLLRRQRAREATE